MSESIKHIQDFINKLKNQKIEINEELIKLNNYKDFEVNQEYENSLNSEYLKLCSDILELQKKIIGVRHKLDMYIDGSYKYKRYKLLKETLENIGLFEGVIQREKKGIKSTKI